MLGNFFLPSSCNYAHCCCGCLSPSASAPLPPPLCLRPSASALLPQPLCLSPSDAVIVCTTCERAADLEKGAPTDLDKSHACPSFHPLPPLPLGPALL